MYDETNVPPPDLRVRPVVRYVLTRYFHPFQAKDGSYGSSGKSEVIAEFSNEERAEEVKRGLELTDQSK